MQIAMQTPALSAQEEDIQNLVQTVQEADNRQCDPNPGDQMQRITEKPKIESMK